MPRVNRHDKWTHQHWDEPYRSAWKVAIAPGNIFQEGGPANRLAPRTVWNNERAFGRYQDFNKRKGRCDRDVLPEIDNLRDFAAELGETLAPYSVWAIITQLTGALRLMIPSADLHYLTTVGARMTKGIKPVRAIDQRLLDPIGLIRVGMETMQEVETRPQPGCWDSHQYRVGALINAAAQFPLRLGNWQMMRIGQHIDLDTGRISFTAKEMKRKKPFEGTLSPEALKPIRNYVFRYRSKLICKDAIDKGYLWPSEDGGMLHRNSLGRIVKSTILRRTGKSFNFHLFRHSAATFISERKPEQTDMAAGVLHHGSLRMTNKHYIRGTKRRAFKMFQSAVRAVIVKGRRKQQQRAQPKGTRPQAKRPQLRRKPNGPK